MITEKHSQESPEGGLVPEVTTEEFSIVRKEGNEQVQRESEENSVVRNYRITATEGKMDLPMPALTEGKHGDNA
jgi:hypothetical protein